MAAVKSPTLDKQLAHKLLNGLFGLLRKYAEDRKTVPSQTELERYISHRVRVTTNDRTTCRNIGDYLLRIREAQKHFEKLEFSDFLEEPIVADQRIVVRFNVDVVRPNGKKAQFQRVAILKVEEDKIASWNELIHEKGSGDLESLLELAE